MRYWCHLYFQIYLLEKDHTLKFDLAMCNIIYCYNCRNEFVFANIYEKISDYISSFSKHNVKELNFFFNLKK